ncbi:MAG: HisA/HisF-related TIM barrel protein [Acidobacteriota bacterium]|nr:HisA/HisF-related TIM barrel protein [Acidobacteriota bacterium]
MLIPSIDLQGGRIVQLVQGEKLAVQTDDIDAWVGRFAAYPKVQLIDLDAAKAAGDNAALVARICGALPCRVGGGIRTVERAEAAIAAGARKVILGSSLFRDGAVDVEFARRLSERVGPDRLIAAVDGRGGRVVIDGWRTALDLTPVEAVSLLEPFFGEFLYTHVDLEGLMRGTDMAAITAVRNATSRAVTAAGGITTREEIDALHAIGVDAVVGMAIYTGRLSLD